MSTELWVAIIAFATAIASGVFSGTIFCFQQRENKKRDNEQLKRDDAHTLNLKMEKAVDISKSIYDRIKSEDMEKLVGKIGLFGVILREVEKELETK